MSEWISVKDRLPEPKRGTSYMTYGTGVVLVLHEDRPDYPVTAHAFLGDNLDSLGVRILTNGASKYKFIEWRSVGRNLCNPFDMASSKKGLFRDSAGYERFLPNYFGFGITHWAELPPLPFCENEILFCENDSFNIAASA
jgi:hypothetical protein